MTQLAIKGHVTRGKEVIQLLEILGGKSNSNMNGYNDDLYYFIAKDGLIYGSNIEYEELNCKYTIFALEEFEEKFPYKVGDKVIAYAEGCLAKFTIQDMRWNYELNKVEYKICSSWLDASLIQPYKEETNMKTDCKNCGLHYGSVRCFDMDYCPNNQPKLYAVGLKDGEVIKYEVNMEDNKATGSRIDFSLTERIELDLGDTHEVVVENGKTYVVKKKPQYPKDYDECCEVLMGKTDFQDFELVLTKLSTNINEENSISPEPPYISLINNFYKLLICRDAYWKIAGEQMGLRKLWKPDWCSELDLNYTIIYNGLFIIKLNDTSRHALLAFPTAEMRDAFYENFKDLIEQCKELL